jgi:hypothetical protein
MRTDPSRFDRVLAHPDYQAAPDQPVLPADAIGVAVLVGPLTMSIFGIVFLLIALTLIHEIHPPLAISILVIGGALVLLLGGVGMIAKLVQFRRAPVERFVAVIVKERSEVSAGGDEPAHTRYFTTLQTRDGARAEYATYRSLVGRLAVDDIGVAYTKAGTLVEFLRFEVK